MIFRPQKTFLLNAAFCCLFLMGSFQAAGQTEIKGNVSSDAGEVLFGISILVHPLSNTNNILTYAISDTDGNFVLSYSSGTDSVLVSAKSLNYKDTLLKVPNANQNMSLILPPEIHEIREVSVRNYPISQKGDTLNYIVGSFARLDDQSIGDVISHMPGFEVTEQGQIYYQGKPIQKYYIEGLDLLENRYSIANRNLPHKSVGSVQVMQNHQPVKMLEDKIASDGTSLNIKLKNDVALTGTMYAGAGFSPFLRDINLTPMLFHKKQQIITSFQSNNIGDNLNTQHQPLQIISGQLEGLKNRKPELLGILPLNSPQIDEKRYFDNNANLLTYNHLLKIKNGTELKINSSYYYDLVKESATVETDYFLDDDTVNVFENTQNRYYNKSLSTDFVLTQNEEKRYITNKFSVNKFWDSQKGLISNDFDLEEEARLPHFSVANDLDLLFPVKRNFLRIYSFVDHNNSPQQLSFQPGVFENVLNTGMPYQKTTQNFSLKNLITHHFVQFTLKRNSWIFESEPGIKFEDQHLETSIEKEGSLLNADSLNNNLAWKYVEVYIDETVRYERDNLKMSLQLPVRNISIPIEDKFHDSPNKISKLFFSPSFYLKYDLWKFFTSRFTVKYNSQLGDVKDLTQGYIFKSYRNLSRGANRLAEKTGFRYSVGLEYENPITGFFSTANWLTNRSNNNLLLKQQVTSEGLLFYDVIEKNNRSVMNNFSLKLSQYLSGWQATFDLKAFYNSHEKEYLLNESLNNLKNRLYAINPGISVNRWKRVNLQYSYQFQLIRQISSQAEVSVVNQEHKASFFITPIERHLIGFDWEYYGTHQSGQAKSNVFFANFSYHFNPQKGKFKYKISANNLFNQSEFVRFYQSDISLMRSSYRINPRQILFTVSLGL
ncbi:MAG TPA: hypothetical protein VJ919_00565 [Tangfeifania sp.]|nr:hypothetical protein [Tangfeifania sp.]